MSLVFVQYFLRGKLLPFYANFRYMNYYSNSMSHSSFADSTNSINIKYLDNICPPPPHFLRPPLQPSYLKMQTFFFLHNQNNEVIITLHQVLTGQSLKERQKLEREIQKLKDEETRLKERLIQTQQELEKLEREISDMAERCAELERVNNRQQR